MQRRRCWKRSLSSDVYVKALIKESSHQANRPRKYNIPRLKHDEVLKAFVVEIKNQFQLLSTEETDRPHVEGKWNNIMDVYCNTAKNTLASIAKALARYDYPLTYGGESKRRNNQVQNSQHQV